MLPGLQSPFVWGVGRPRLMWPAGDSGAPRNPRAVMAHELAHVKRRDHWVAWFEIVATSLLWWNPLVWFVRRGAKMKGPFPAGVIANHILLGRIREGDELSSDRKEWLPLSEHQELIPDVMKADLSDPYNQERLAAAMSSTASSHAKSSITRKLKPCLR